MALYRYKAVQSDGKEVNEVMTAATITEVQEKIRDKGLYLIQIREDVEKKSAAEELSFGGKVTAKQISIFCKQFATLLKAGVPVASGLDILYRQTENKKFKSALEDVYTEVQKGSQVSTAIRNHPKVFPSLMVNMVESGEMSGNLDNIMERLAIHYEKDAKINSRIKGAMIYPIALSVISVVVVIFLITVILPTFTGMFTSSGTELPLPTRILLGISDFIRNYWYIVIGAVGFLIFVVNRYLSSSVGRYQFDALKFKLPVVKGSMDKIVTARFTRTLGSLLRSGIPLIDALELAGSVTGNVVIEEKVNYIASEVEKGETLGVALKRTPTFGPMVVSMIQIGEESGSLDQMLDKSADFYEQELEDAIDRLLKLMEPLLIVVMAIVIGFIVISMALPMFDMVNTI
ncbi:type II secretion system F family protein [Proteiniclasticum ruminis]|uniref:Type IV pilus assembly protein PilC n=1 Tax=Proteiniclasticum ruminis TaxID=398199 RepID=A0A1I4XMZ2_9CLOT|nr:type II secretion system F family protein [Proteiniclasticum ruminis]SFN27214.1 type IV pilus assembly protein PilC [Proteiniclasticum ruminis]